MRSVAARLCKSSSRLRVDAHRGLLFEPDSTSRRRERLFERWRVSPRQHLRGRWLGRQPVLRDVLTRAYAEHLLWGRVLHLSRRGLAGDGRNLHATGVSTSDSDASHAGVECELSLHATHDHQRVESRVAAEAARGTRLTMKQRKRRLRADRRDGRALPHTLVDRWIQRAAECGCALADLPAETPPISARLEPAITLYARVRCRFVPPACRCQQQAYDVSMQWTRASSHGTNKPLSNTGLSWMSISPDSQTPTVPRGR